MKNSIHPETRNVVFKDMVTGHMFLASSTAVSNETVQFTDGKTYPLVKVEVSSSSHPAYNGGIETEKASSQRESFDKKYGRS